MPTSDWLPLAATALGGVLTAGGGALTQWVNDRRSAKRERDDLRRAAYVDLIAAANDLIGLMVRWRSSDPDELLAAISSVEHACAEVTVAGPGKVAQGAGKLRQEAARLRSANRYRDELGVKGQLVPVKEACQEFSDLAQSALGTDQD